MGGSANELYDRMKWQHLQVCGVSSKHLKKNRKNHTVINKLQRKADQPQASRKKNTHTHTIE